MNRGFQISIMLFQISCVYIGKRLFQVKLHKLASLLCNKDLKWVWRTVKSSIHWPSLTQFVNLLKLQLHSAIYWLRFYSNLFTHILSLSNSHNNVASIQKNRGDKSHCVIVALDNAHRILIDFTVFFRSLLKVFICCCSEVKRLYQKK